MLHVLGSGSQSAGALACRASPARLGSVVEGDFGALGRGDGAVVLAHHGRGSAASATSSPSAAASAATATHAASPASHATSRSLTEGGL